MAIFERTFKIAVSAALATWIAMALGLENAYAAGVIAILSILDTVTASVQTAISRIWSTILAFSVATAVFYFMGYTIPAFGVYLAIYVPLAYKWKGVPGIAPCSVLVTHFIIAESCSLSWWVNGLGLMLIGTASALLLSFFRPSQAAQIESGKEDIEETMRVVLHLMGKRLVDSEMSMKSIDAGLAKLSDQLERVGDLALQEYGDQVFSRDEGDLGYLQMRQEQYQLLCLMARSLKDLSVITPQHRQLASLFTETADELHESNPGDGLLEDLDQLTEAYRSSSLPQTRPEFESRAVLYQLLLELQRFLDIKHQYYLQISK